MKRAFFLDLGRVGVGAQTLATDSGDDIHEASVVLHALLCPMGARGWGERRGAEGVGKEDTFQ